METMDKELRKLGETCMKGQRITLNREIFFKAHISEAEMYRNK